jgi:hypothetical protein
VGPRMRQGGKSPYSKEMRCYERNLFWHTILVCPSSIFLLQYPQAQKSAHLGMLKSEKYGREQKECEAPADAVAAIEYIELLHVRMLPVAHIDCLLKFSAVCTAAPERMMIVPDTDR